jgi:UDP-N-acetylmuramoyl-tripeptide--D-alanyl-D-alanine ligase
VLLLADKPNIPIIVNKKLQMTPAELYKYYLSHPTICTDTRKIIRSSLFFALKGDNFDANKFALQALEQGASFVVIDDVKFKIDDRFLLVDDTLLALQELAKYHRQQLNIPVIGLTGSNGKTTTKELIFSVLSQKFKTQATKGNLNNHIGVPLTILEIKPDCEVAIIEMGANHQKEIEMLCQICQPNFGLITNIGKAHLEGFGGIEGVKIGKGELFDFLDRNEGVAFINKNSTQLLEMAQSRSFKDVVFYGSDAANFVSGKLLQNDPLLEIEWIHEEEHHQIKSNLTGIYNFENILAAIAIGLKFSLSAEEINIGISSYEPQNNRSQIINTPHNTVIGDYYNANPSSMTVAIENLAKLNADQKVLILGDMFELGEEAAFEHEQVLEKALSYNFTKRIFIGEEFYKMNELAEAIFCKSTNDAIAELKKNPIKNSLILLKGSRSMKLESLMELL